MKKLIAMFWGALTTLIILVALSCDTTKPKPPVIFYELNLIHDAVDSDVYADFNITKVNIIAELKDENGDFMEGKTISFTWENTDHAITLGTIDTPTATTNTNGKVSVNFDDNGQTGMIEVTARYVDEYQNVTTKSVSFSILPLEEKVSTMTLNSSAAENMVIVTDDAPEIEYQTEFNAFIRDDLNNPVENLNVNFTNLTMLGGLLSSQALTDSIGKASVTLVSLGSELGNASIKAYITINDLARAVESSDIPLTFEEYDFQHLERSSTEIADTLTVQFILQSQYLITNQVAAMTLDAVPEIIHMDDSIPDSVYTITLNSTVTDSNGVAVSGVPVHFENLTPELGTISGTNISTNSSGVATTTLTASLEDAGEAQVRATILDPENPGTPAFSANETIFLQTLSQNLIDQVASMSLNAIPEIVQMDDSNPDSVYTITLNSTVIDSNGVAVSGVLVHFENLTPELGTISGTNITTNSSGVATTTLTASLEDAGEVQVRATILDPENPGTPAFSAEDTILLQTLSQGLIDQVASMSLNAIPEIVQMDDSIPDSVYTITLNSTVRDSNGVALSGVFVHFENLTPGLGTISGTNISTNSSGVAATTLIAGLEDAGEVQIRANILDPENPGTPAFSAEETIYLQTMSQNILEQAATLSTWIVSGILPDGNNNTSNVDTLYARVTNESGGSVQGIPVHFERIAGTIGVLSVTNVQTDADGIAKSIFTTLTSEITQDSMTVSIQISVPGSNLDPQVRVFTFNFEGSEVLEYNVNRFEWYKGFSVSNGMVQQIFNGDLDSISVSSDFDYLLLVASVIDFDGVRINRIPVRFSINNDLDGPNGDLSNSIEHTCCAQDSLGGNLFLSPGDLSLLNYVIDPGHPDEANGLVPILYYNQSVNVCDNLVSEIVDPLDNSIILHTNTLKVCTVEEDVVNPIDLVQNLTFTTNPDNVLLVDNAPDSTYQVVLTATLRDEDGVPVSGASVQFINHTPTEGILLHGTATSNSFGYARDTLFVTHEDVGPIQLETIVETSPAPLSQTSSVGIYDYAPPTLEVDHIEAWPKYSIISISDPSLVYTDTLYAKALTAGGAVIPSAPMYFSLTNPSVGSISANQVFTNSEGIASVVYYTSIGIQPGSVEFVVSVPTSPEVEPVHKFIAIVGQSLPDSTVSTLTLNANPDQIIVLEDVSDTTYSITFRSVAKDIYGVAVQNVPVYFQNLTPTIGTLNLSLSFTDSIGVATSVLNLENNIFGTANIKSYILSSLNDNDTLFVSYNQVDVMTENDWHLQSVSTLLTWPSTPNIQVTRMDSIYCDTLYAVAQNASGGGVKDINIDFSLDPTNLGYLTHSEAITDTSGSASTTFCVIPGTLNTSVDVEVSIPEASISPSSFSIEIQDNLPECPDCTAELSLWANCYVLPGCPDSTVTTVFATYVDTLGNGPTNNTIIQFQSLKDSSGTWVPIASIDPWGQFQNDTARVTFNMTNDEGIANIIGSYAGLQDTIQIVLNAGDLEYLQFQPSYPSEIMVQGGGGLEATEISVELRDGSDNLVSNDYLIHFEITEPTPSDVHFNGQLGLTDIDIISSNGIASVTVNAGTHPGSVRVQATAYELEDILHTNMISSAVGIPVTINTGPPTYGIIALSYVDLLTPGGGVYQLPMSISLWDINSNPVNDSTTVWLSLYEYALPYDSLGIYTPGDLVMWAEPNSSPTDSLVYKCITELDFIQGVAPSGTPFSEDHWALNIHPGIIEGEAKTGEPNMNGEAFRGIAWASAYYTSLNVFKNIIIKAQTYDGNGDWLIIDSRAGNDGLPFPQPIFPGQVTISSSVVFWDFSTFPNVSNPPDMIGGGCFTDIIQIGATLTDYYMEFISNGHLQLNIVGGLLLEDPPPFDPNWDPNLVQITDPNGQARWYVRYNMALCPVTDPQTCNEPNDCDACEYDDFQSAVWVNLLDPQQMTSNQVEIQLQRSGGECSNCP